MPSQSESLQEHHENLREPLKRVTAIRCLMVTLLLGSAFAVNVNNLDSFEHPSYSGLKLIIITTYLVTVALSLALWSGRHLLIIAHVGLAFDALVAGGLVLLTGGFESPFAYLFVIVAMYGGVLLGRDGGVAGAAYTSLSVVGVVLFTAGVFHASWVVPGTGETGLYPSSMLAIASSAAGVLSGILRERLEKTTVDLAASHRTLTELRNVNAAILANLPVGVFTIAPDGEVQHANPIAKGFLQTLDSSGLEGLEALGVSEELANESEPWEQDIVLASGAIRTLELTSSPLLDSDRRQIGALLVFQDRTSLRQVQESLAQRDRLSTVGRFAASIAHEIRNPLAAVSGSVELLAEMSDDSSDSSALLEIILAEIDRLNGLVGDMLTYSSPHRSAREIVDLTEIIRDAGELFTHQVNLSRLSFELELPDEATCYIDPDAVRQILLNLWRNATDAQPEKGARVRTTLDIAPHDIVLTVSDDGEGIPKEVAKRIFEPFFSTKKRGFGLGLATVFQLVEASGGSIGLARSVPVSGEDPHEPLGGASFEIRLPRTSASHPRLPSVPIAAD